MENIYETEKSLREYLLFHYGDADAVLGNLPGPKEAVDFATRCVTELLDEKQVPDEASALDIGCSVGRSSFELARHAKTVLGIDFSQRFIDVARELCAAGHIGSQKLEEGVLFREFQALVPAGIDRSRVRFEQGDAMALPASLGAYDIVLAANLLCRLSQPRLLLDRLPSLVQPGGQLLLITPFSWLEEFTPQANWLGGTPDGKRSLPTLKGILDPHFTLAKDCNLPFLIREHSRKFQYGISWGTRWIRCPA